jgi:hypothetical protein
MGTSPRRPQILRSLSSRCPGGTVPGDGFYLSISLSISLSMKLEGLAVLPNEVESGGSSEVQAMSA